MSDFRRATEEEGNQVVGKTVEVIAEWFWEARRINLSPDTQADIRDILQQELGDRLGTNEGEIGG